MKKQLFMLAFAGMAILSACNEETMLNEKEHIAYASVTLSNETNAKSTITTTEAQDSTFIYADVFVFNSEGNLDGYKHMTSKSEAIQATAGEKTIYAVVNAHNLVVNSIQNETQFNNTIALLQDENSENFTLVGSTQATLSTEAPTPVIMAVSRLVAKIELQSLTVNFAGTPLAGKSLSNVEIYLTNVPNQMNFSGTSSGSVNGSTWDADGNLTMANIIADDVHNVIADGSQAPSSHYFFPYQKYSVNELSGSDCIRLIIKAGLDADGDNISEIYYWSIPINCAGKGGKNTESADHYGVKSNYRYIYDVVITRQGISADEEDPENSDIEYAMASGSLTIVPWQTGIDADVNF